MQLTIDQISKTLPNGKTLLDNISFTVEPGEFVGILGPSGAGKTLTIRAINGLLKPTSGAVFLTNDEGETINITGASKKTLRLTRQKIGVIFQGFNLVKRLTALENVLIGKLGGINPWRSLFKGFTNEEAEEALALLDQMGVKELAFRRVASLSGGEMQRVAIARALIQKPIILLADEPIANLDPSNALGVMQLLAPLKAQMPIVGVFHQPEMTARFCTRVIALNDGKIIYDGDPKLDANQLLKIYGEKISEILIV